MDDELTTLDKCADAIRRSIAPSYRPNEFVPWENSASPYREQWINQAKAVILTLRKELTDHTLTNGFDALCDGDAETIEERDLCEAWRTMLEEISHQLDDEGERR